MSMCEWNDSFHSFLKSYYFNFCVGVFCLANIYLCTMCMPFVYGGQKKALDILELEFQLVVSHYMSAGNEIWDLRKSSQCF